MKLIVGLGNPGSAYSGSRHNIGFLVVQSLAKVYKTQLKKERGVSAKTAKAKIGGQLLILAMPLTFMNLSGSAVKALVRKYKVSLEDLLVICDDLDLDFGRIKIRPGGSSAGQRGLESIIDYFKSQEFPRLRIGIGRPKADDIDAATYVLSYFNNSEKKHLKAIIKKASSCARSWLEKGVIESMNIFNQQKVVGQV